MRAGRGVGPDNDLHPSVSYRGQELQGAPLLRLPLVLLTHVLSLTEYSLSPTGSALLPVDRCSNIPSSKTICLKEFLRH